MIDLNNSCSRMAPRGVCPRHLVLYLGALCNVSISRVDCYIF